MREYTGHRDGTPLAKGYWGTFPDPRQPPKSNRDKPVGLAVGLIFSGVVLASLALIGALQLT